MNKGTQLLGLADRSVAEWEELLIALRRLVRDPGYQAVVERLYALQLNAITLGMSPANDHDGTQLCKGENKAYKRAILVLGDLLKDVQGVIAQDSPARDLGAEEAK